MTELIIVIAVAYLLFHLGAGHTHYRYRKAHGLQPNFYWSSIRGPYAKRPAARRVPGRPQGVASAGPPGARFGFAGH